MALLKNLHGVDAQAFHWCNTRKNREQLAVLARMVSRTGDGPVYAVLAAVMAVAGGDMGRLFFACALLSYAIDVPLYLLLKNTIKRERPFRTLQTHHYITPSDHFSFPSGHTAGAFVWAVLIAAFFPVFAPVALVWAVMVGSSRVLLGVHYPGDILAGIFLGSGSAALALLALT